MDMAIFLSSSPWLTILALTILVSAIRIITQRKLALPFPPGPRKRFLIGNLLDLPTSYEWLTYTKWAKQYGKARFYFAAQYVDRPGRFRYPPLNRRRKGYHHPKYRGGSERTTGKTFRELFQQVDNICSLFLT